MKKIFTIIITLLIIIAAGILTYISNNDSVDNVTPNPIVKDIPTVRYIINEEEIVLVNGVSYTQIPGAKSTTTTRYFGNDIKADFDNDGNEDIAFIVTQTTSGSGVFYYLVATLNKKDGAVGTYGFFIGDRIAPQSTSLGTNNTIVINYADRKPGESFVTAPSVGKSVILKFDTNINQFGEVVKNFEGEADPKVMKLDMKTWTWVSTTYNDGKVIKPKTANKFNLTFKGKTFSVSTDCNGIGGEFTLNGNQITFEKMMSTLMFCEGSQESEFSKSLAEVSSYRFTSKGELVFDLKYDSGVMIFR